MRALGPIESEFERCSFPDARLLSRVKRMAAQVELAPQQSFPDLFSDASQLEATYRFFGNKRVELATIIKGHIDNTIRRVRAAGRCLAIHDTTTFVFEGDRDDMGFVDQAQQGFLAHACLAVSADGEREPFGLLALDTWVRPEKKGKRTTEARKKEENIESERWLNQSLDVEAAIPKPVVVVHVEDREADIFESLALRSSLGMHFIVRAASTRVAIEDDGSVTNVMEKARTLEPRFSRRIDLSARHGKFAHRPKAQHRDRQAREADIEVRAGEIRVRAPLRGGAVSELRLNAVHVREGAPPKGEAPVEWLLFTTEPIETADDVAWVIDSYRTRWLIEEYFKALKTGCKYEERQLESLDSLLNALGIFAIVAWRLLVLRFIERTAGDAPASTVATDAEISVLVALNRLQPNATAHDFLRALAKFGGHLSQNGPPGLLILWRALRKLQERVEGWLLAQKM